MTDKAIIEDDVVLYEDGANHRLVLRSDGNGDAIDLQTQYWEEAADTCVLTGAEGENAEDCTTHKHERAHDGKYVHGGHPTLSTHELIQLGHKLVRIGMAKAELEDALKEKEE